MPLKEAEEAGEAEREDVNVPGMYSMICPTFWECLEEGAIVPVTEAPVSSRCNQKGPSRSDDRSARSGNKALDKQRGQAS